MNIPKENNRQFRTMYENFRKLRGKKGMTVEELSMQTGISAEILKETERYGGDFGVDDLILLCRFYGLKPYAIFHPLDQED